MTPSCGEGARRAEGCDEGGKEGSEGTAASEKQRESGDDEQGDGGEDDEVWGEGEARRAQREGSCGNQNRGRERGRKEPSRHRVRRQHWGVVSLLQDQTAHNAR